MELRAKSISGASVPRSFLAMTLVLVAMGLAAMGGYVAKDAFGGSASGVTGQQAAHPAAGTVLRQDTPAQASAELPGWMQREIASNTNDDRIIVDDPNYYRQYLTGQSGERQPDHGVIP